MTRALTFDADDLLSKWGNFDGHVPQSVADALRARPDRSTPTVLDWADVLYFVFARVIGPALPVDVTIERMHTGRNPVQATRVNGRPFEADSDPELDGYEALLRPYWVRVDTAYLAAAMHGEVSLGWMADVGYDTLRLAARAGLGTTETHRRHQNGTLDPDTLRTLAALRHGPG